jgi:phosphoglycolate phosphatase-like HAD superfamily hydrolase
MEKFLSQYELNSAEKSKLFPETILTLETLRKLGIKIGLVTNTSAKAMDTIFQIHGLRDYFDVVVTRESVRKLKPDPEGILLAIRELGARNFFMVGDLILDVLAAKNAKGTAIIVKREMEKAEQQDLKKSLPVDSLKEIRKIQKERANLQADYIVKSLSEIPEIVQVEMRKSQC